MVVSRRNILIGLGAVVGGGGALVGTGAFSTVSATRSVDVNTSGDAGGQIGLNLNPPLGGSDGNDTINISVGRINLDALTTFDEAFDITNNSTENGGVEIAIDIRDPDAGRSLIKDPTSDLDNDNPRRLMFYNGKENDDDDEDNNFPDDNRVPPGETLEYNVVLNTVGTKQTGQVGADYFPQQIAIVAEQVTESGNVDSSEQ